MQGRKDGSKVGAACGARSPHPVCGQPRGESEGQALNLGPSPPRAAWTEARNEGDGKAPTASRYSPPPATTSTAAEGGGGKMAPPAPGRSRFRHSGRPADGGGGGGTSQGAGRSRAEAVLPPLPPAHRRRRRAPGPAARRISRD